jgi:hypothetical protein
MLPNIRPNLQALWRVFRDAAPITIVVYFFFFGGGAFFLAAGTGAAAAEKTA